MKPNFVWSESDSDCFFSDGTTVYNFEPRAKVYRRQEAAPGDGIWLPVGNGLYDFCAPKAYNPKFTRASRQTFMKKPSLCIEFDEPEVPGLVLKLYVDPKSDLPLGWEQVTGDTIYRGVYTKIDLKTTYTKDSFKWEPPSDAVDTEKIPRVSKLLKPGTPAPSGELLDFKNKKIDLPSLWKKDKGLLICFWYFGCGYSQREVKFLASIESQCKQKGLDFLFINRDDSTEVIKSFLSKTKYDIRIAMNGESVAKSYGVVAFPTLYLVKPTGEISFVMQGYGDSDNSVILEELSKLGVSIKLKE